MKQRIIALCLTFAMLISCIPSAAIVGQATSIQSGTDRRLTNVKVYDGSMALTGDYEFHYDSDFLTGITSRTYGDYAYESSVALTYDTAGRLISRISGNPDMPGMNSGSEYTYNSAGQLISSLHWEGGAVEETYEYDSTGKLIRAVENYDAGKTITEYSYNEDGLLISAIETSTEEWSGDTWSETIDYSYDRQNRLSKVSCTGGYSDSLTTYNYQYQPFVLSEYIDSYGYSNTNLLLQDDNGYTLHSFYLSNPELYTDAGGYLAKVVDTSSYSNEVQTYVFYYDGVAAESVGENSTLNQSGAWNQVYYDFIIQDRSDAESSEDWEWVGYELIYLDDDTIPELWITYSSWAAGCRIVSYRDGKLTQELIGSGTLSYEEYGNAFHHSYGHMGLYFDTIFKLENGELVTVAEGRNETTINEDGSQNYDVMNYFWNDTQVSEEAYTQNIVSLIHPDIAKETSYDDQYSYVEILDYLSSVKIEDVQEEDSDNAYEDYARTEWINKHIEYANSDQYKTQVIQGFSGALDDALEDIKGNGMITAYNTLDSINTILDFDLDLTDVEEYELLLAQILFSRTGTTSINEIYDEYLSNNIIIICEILIENIPEMTSSEINEKVEKLKELLTTIKGLSRGDTQYNEVLSQIMDSISSFDDLNFGKEFVEAFDKAGLSFAADFVVSEIDTVENTLSEVIVYMAAGDAYCNTSDAFGDMILALRKHIAIPSDNSIFEPYQSDKILVNDQMIWTKLGLKNAGNSIGPDPLNTPIYLSALAKAIENYYTQLEAAKTGNASVIAQNAMAEFATETADNLIDAELNVVVSLFECLPVVKQFSAIKALFDGTQFVIDTFTGIDDRAYLGTMVMRLYGIAYIHYLSVDNLATHTDAWGTITTFSPMEQKFDANAQFADAAQFDEAMAVYRAILSVATDYAEEYYTTYYEAADSILSKYPNYKPTIPPYVDTDSDTFKSVKQKIIELQMQKNDLAYEWCHSSKIIFNQLHGVNTYDSSEMLIYSFKCPVSVTFKNESGEIIAILSNGNSTVSAGYEQYFFTSEVISGSGEYVKIAAVPQSYEVVIEGIGTGRMDVSVSEYNNGQLGETKQYFGVPVSEDSSGYFGVKDEDGEDFCLIMDDTAYAEGDHSNIELDDGNKMTLYIAIVAIGVVCVGLAVIILKRKKSPK